MGNVIQHLTQAPLQQQKPELRSNILVQIHVGRSATERRKSD